MKKIKKIIIILSIILIIGIIMLVTLLNIAKNKNTDEIYENTDYYAHAQGEVQQQLERVTSNVQFYTIENCVKKYESFVNINYKIQYDELNYPSLASIYHITNEQQKKGAILKFLDKEYIEKNEITENNLEQYINMTLTEINITVLQVNKLIDINSNIEGYSVYAHKEYNNETKDAYYIVKLNKEQEVFSIYPIEARNIDEIDIKNETTNIEKNDRNTYIESNITEGQIATNYFQEFKTLMLNNQKEAYQKLDQKYREKKFNSLEGYAEYIQKNKETIENMQIAQYQTNQYDNYVQYICLDMNNKYYIIQEKAPREYSIILDTYTVDLPEFTEKYNEASEEQKVGLNVQRIFDAINDGDYRYMYNKLDSTFKANNFKTEAEFEKYVKENFYANNTIEHNSYEKNGNLYMYNITIKNKTDEKQQITKTIIMQLKEGTDFVMSFNIE